MLVEKSEIVVFKPKHGHTEFQLVLDGNAETIWLMEQQIMELFGKSRRTIGEHIRNIYTEGELEKKFNLAGIPPSSRGRESESRAKSLFVQLGCCNICRISCKIKCRNGVS